MIKIDSQYKALLLEALEDMMYKLSLQLDELKGGPLDQERKALTQKQTEVEKLHILFLSIRNKGAIDQCSACYDFKF
ncbi:hypothetical protein C900_02583 [Fulvivirga imtechensis AK7]|uniref:Uncharacterized protein n=1 Tax=Fulvivirga imtechensis AK7 TaxID=1237149 RepID=L8JRN0_9BACT|nr:hypothetical protein [Fulvivirga imtechensis]ELR71520.1 hypothetical protein C900_02583 [Fulvivirga imtechensis AK7]